MTHRFLDTAPPEPLTLSVAKAWLKRDEGDSSEDALLEILIKSARETAEKYTGLLFTRRQVEVTFQSREGGVVLPFGPNIALGTVTRIGEGGAADLALTGGIDYRYGTDGLEIGLLGFPRYWRVSVGLMQWSYRAVYHAGYAEGQLPGDLHHAMLEILAFSYRNRGDVATTERGGQVATIIPPHARGVLDQYRLNRWELV